MITVIPETASTNTEMRDCIKDFNHLDFLLAANQSCGRGQRGNSWEAEPGKNLTGSICIRLPEFKASWQFQLSEAVALAVSDTLKDYGVVSKIKWPNDIYVGDKKICGILIEHSVMGSDILYSIAGIGVNINQKAFKSDAPNPVSLIELCPKPHPSLSSDMFSISESGAFYNIKSFAAKITENLAKRLINISSEGKRACLHREFKENLWRKDGVHPWISNCTEFLASIIDVEPQGFLILKLQDNTLSRYAFGQIKAKLK